MTTTTKFKAAILDNLLMEIFGSNEDKYNDPLLLKNISQRTKFHLKKLGEELRKEMNIIKGQLRDLYNKYYETVEEDGKSVRKIREEMKETDFLAEAAEIESIEVEIPHFDFHEEDFIDKATNDVIAGKIYYNLIDALIYNIPVEEDTKTLV